MSWRPFLSFVVVVALAVSPRVARAEDEDREPDVEATDATMKQRAKRQFLRGKNAFEIGDYEEAIKGYAEAYRLVDDPALLYNLALSHRLAEHAAAALHFYRLYLERVPNAANRDEVEQRIAELDKIVPKADRKRRYVEEPKRESNVLVAKRIIKPPPSRSLVIGGGVTLALGLAGLGAGGICALLGSQAREDLRRDSEAGAKFDASLQAQGKTANAAMASMLTIGGVGLIIGTTLVAVGRSRMK